MNKYAECVENAKKFLELSEKYNVRIIGCDFKPYINIIQSLEALHEKSDEKDFYITKFAEKFPDCPDALFYLGVMLLGKKLFKEALEQFESALKLSADYGGIYINTVEKSRALVYNNCGVCEENLLNISSAMNWYFKASNEPKNYEVSLFNLLRIVKKMPVHEVSNFALALYNNTGEVKHMAVLSALMANYMTDQIVNCYAAFRIKKSQDVLFSDVTAFIMAGKKNYLSASQMFMLNFKGNQSKDSATRALLCAALSGDSGGIEKAVEIADNAQVFALGLSELKETEVDIIPTISKIFIECERLGEINFAVSKIQQLKNRITDEQMLNLASLLSNSFTFYTALAAAKQVESSPKSVFLQGYFCYMLRRFSVAEECFKNAEEMGLEDPAIAKLSENIKKVRGFAHSLTEAEKDKLKERIESEINEGKFDEARNDILKYKHQTEPDTQIYTAESTLYFYCGEYQKAAAAAEAGILKDSKSVDLLYNAGCIYEKLNDKSRAAEMFENALENCTDERLAEEIRKSLMLVTELSGI
jgi:tetratricopeptide (TPR) repeat protein